MSDDHVTSRKFSSDQFIEFWPHYFADWKIWKHRQNLWKICIIVSTLRMAGPSVNQWKNSSKLKKLYTWNFALSHQRALVTISFPYEWEYNPDDTQSETITTLSRHLVYLRISTLVSPCGTSNALMQNATILLDYVVPFGVAKQDIELWHIYPFPEKNTLHAD